MLKESMRRVASTYLKNPVSVTLLCLLSMALSGAGCDRNTESSDERAEETSESTVSNLEGVPLIDAVTAPVQTKPPRPLIPTIDLNWPSPSQEETEPSCIEEVPLAPPTTRLLTRLEYHNTVIALFGDVGQPTEDFPPETTALGFGNGQAHGPNPLLVNRYLNAAEEVSTFVVENNLDNLIACDPENNGAVTCGEAFIQEWGTKIFRRPLDFNEFLIFHSLYLSAFSQWGFETAIRLALQAMLQSPQFLYRIELGLPAQTNETIVMLSGYELASRLSFLLWNAPPDTELLEFASSEALLTTAGLEQQARRLLDDDRAKETLHDFHQQWLGLEKLSGMTKDTSVFPAFNEEVRTAWESEMRQFIEYAFWDSDDPLATFFESPTSFVNAELAEIYNLDGEFAADSFTPVDLSSSMRSGILTQPGLLSVLAYPDQSSPIARGIFVREKLLCEPLPAPPDDIPIIPPDPNPDATTRERFAQHTQSPSCQGCHVLIDPIGFGFEAYDGMGNWRATENGLPIDTSGELLYTHSGDPLLEGPFDGVFELSSRLQQSEQVKNCITTQWFRYSMGRHEETSDQCGLETIQHAFSETNGDVKELLVALVMRDFFRYRTAPAFGDEQ